MAEVFANSEDPDQTPHSAASDLGLHFCQLPFQGSPNYNGSMRLFGLKFYSPVNPLVMLSWSVYLTRLFPRQA